MRKPRPQSGLSYLSKGTGVSGEKVKSGKSCNRISDVLKELRQKQETAWSLFTFFKFFFKSLSLDFFCGFPSHRENSIPATTTVSNNKLW